MKINIIVAMDEQNGIGKNNQIPWKSRDDFAHFKATTLGFPVLMGRNTWESLPRKPLAQRKNIVVSSRKDIEFCDQLIDSPDKADEDELFAIGGVSIYEWAAKNKDLNIIYITHVCGSYSADVHFPTIDLSSWNSEEIGKIVKNETNNIDARIVKYWR